MCLTWKWLGLKNCCACYFFFFCLLFFLYNMTECCVVGLVHVYIYVPFIAPSLCKSPMNYFIPTLLCYMKRCCSVQLVTSHTEMTKQIIDGNLSSNSYAHSQSHYTVADHLSQTRDMEWLHFQKLFCLLLLVQMLCCWTGTQIGTHDLFSLSLFVTVMIKPQWNVLFHLVVPHDLILCRSGCTLPS